MTVFEAALKAIQEHRVSYGFIGPWCSCGWRGTKVQSGKQDQIEGDRHLAEAIDEGVS
jgi:hypothetical protein